MINFDPLIQACSYLLHNAPEAEEARSYLDNRLKKETQEKFAFGYFPPSNQMNLLSNWLNAADLKELALCYTKEMGGSEGGRSISVGSFDRHPLIMPYKDVYGHIIGIVGRSLLSDADRAEKKVAKYKNTVFTKGSHLFGLDQAKSHILSSDRAYVVEGQFDAIKAMEQGLHNIVALGSADMTAYQFSLLCRYSPRITLILDNDEAGERGRKRAMEKYADFAEIRNVYLPEPNKDIDEYLSSNDIQQLDTFLKEGEMYQ
jgi:DNA primase catalytic core